MVWFVLGIVAILLTIIVPRMLWQNDYPGSTLLGCGLSFLAALCLCASCISTVPTGYTGIVTTFGKVDENFVPNGLNFHWPWQSIVTLSNKEQTFSENNLCFSRDLQEVSYTYTVKYSLSSTNAPTIYQSVGTDYFNILIRPQINNAIKAEFGLVTAEDMTKSRNTIQNNINATVSVYAEQYGISTQVFIDNFDFTDAYTNAIEAKQVAEQEALRDKTQQSMETERTRQQAERTKIEAENAAEVLRINSEADAEAAKIKAQADYEVAQLEADAVAYRGEKEAAATKAMAEAITNGVIDYEYAQNWNGVLPSTIMGGDTIPLVNLGAE